MSQKKRNSAKRRIEKIGTREHHQSKSLSDAVEYFSDRTLAERWEVCRDTVWRWSKDGKIPRPIKLVNNTTRWRRSDIQDWEFDQEGG